MRFRRFEANEANKKLSNTVASHGLTVHGGGGGGVFLLLSKNKLENVFIVLVDTSMLKFCNVSGILIDPHREDS